MTPHKARARARQEARKSTGVNQTYPQHRRGNQAADGITIRVSGCKLRPCTWNWAVVEGGVTVASGTAKSEAEARAEAQEAKRDREAVE